ncbi:MAG TPA: DUF1330 domain-containing protein [Candidatus Eremiobacteraceae bacterium]|nr:DUF1330 domain-containing protein [Candidatus Eremiobacteraceae bacterium]
MAGYIIACVQWHDQEAIERYGAIVVESLRPFNGRYLARGAPVATLEGEHPPQRLAVVEFPSASLARQWYDSEAYRPARSIRAEYATTFWLVVMEGVPR